MKKRKPIVIVTLLGPEPFSAYAGPIKSKSGAIRRARELGKHVLVFRLDRERYWVARTIEGKSVE